MKAVDKDASKTRLVTLLAERRDRAFVVEFNSGFTHISGIASLCEVSDSGLRFQFAEAQCSFVVDLNDSIDTLKRSTFEEAFEDILGNRSNDLAFEEHAAYSSESVEEVIDLQFVRGSRLIIGVIKVGWIGETTRLH